MILLIASWIAAGILVLSIAQSFFALSYAGQLLRSSKIKSDSPLPTAAVILSLRGADPFFYANMLGLLDQDYPDFSLFIIVDSELDSAWPDVHRIQSHAPNRVVTMVVKNHLTTCSLKCCALAEAVEQLDESYEVVAFLDGDASPHRRWLRDLVEPLANTRTGVTTGNRWYTPETITWGSLVRYFWNAGAVVQVWLNEITWAGSMAMRLDVIRKIGLIDAWRKSLSVDGTVSRCMRSEGLKTVFVPTVIMPNKEDISISQFIPWSERQLVAAKSSGSGWAVVLFHAFAIASCIVAPLIVLALGILWQDSRLSWLGFAIMLIYWGTAMASTLIIEKGIQHVLRRNEMKSGWMTTQAWIQFFPAIVLSHLVYFRALAGACFRTRVSWRGVDYQIDGVNEVQRLNYQPYESSIENHDTSSII